MTHWFAVISGTIAVIVIAVAVSGMPLRKNWGRWSPVIIFGWPVCLAADALLGVDLAGWVDIPLVAVAGYVAYRQWRWSIDPDRYLAKV